MTLYHVRVRADYPWDSARIAGRVFHKIEPVEMQEGDLTAEIRGSELLIVEPVNPLGAPFVPVGDDPLSPRLATPTNESTPGLPAPEPDPEPEPDALPETKRAPRRKRGG